GAGGGGDQGDVLANQVGRQLRQSVGLVLRPAIYDRDILTLEVAAVFQATVKSLQATREHFGRYDIKKPNCRHGRPLRPRHNRPCRRAAEQRDELAAPHHSITSSARRSNASEKVRPIALAAFRLITRLNFVGACTGRSLGLAPRRMRSTYDATSK